MSTQTSITTRRWLKSSRQLRKITSKTRRMKRLPESNERPQRLLKACSLTRKLHLIKTWCPSIFKWSRRQSIWDQLSCKAVSKRGLKQQPLHVDKQKQVQAHILSQRQAPELQCITVIHLREVQLIAIVMASKARQASWMKPQEMPSIGMLLSITVCQAQPQVFSNATKVPTRGRLSSARIHTTSTWTRARKSLFTRWVQVSHTFVPVWVLQKLQWFTITKLPR